MERFKILIVDDDLITKEYLRILLENEQYTVVEASSGTETLAKINESFDLVILDIMIPDKNGIEICIDIRKKYWIPILFLTTKTTEYDKHIGLSVGADDYLAKPFSCIELLARISALIRRYNMYPNKNTFVANNEIVVNDLVINTSLLRVYKKNEEINLTNIEFNILLLFVKNQKKIFTIQNIYESIWEDTYNYSVNSTVMVHIKNLRQKLSDTAKKPQYIKNIWGRGYCLVISEKNPSVQSTKK